MLEEVGLRRHVLDGLRDLLGVRASLLHALLGAADLRGRDELHRARDLLRRLDPADPAAKEPEACAHLALVLLRLAADALHLLLALLALFELAGLRLLAGAGLLRRRELSLELLDGLAELPLRVLRQCSLVTDPLVDAAVSVAEELVQLGFEPANVAHRQ